MKFSKRDVYETLCLTASNLVVAVMINLLAWQYRLISGGLTGYAIFINLLTHWSVGQVLLVSNIVLFVLAFILVGKVTGIRAIYGFTSLSFFLDFTRTALNLTQQSPPSLMGKIGLIMILSISMGIAVSIVLANNYSLGAYSTIYVIVKKYVPIPAATLFFVLDFALALISTIVFGIEIGITLAINAIVAYYVVKIFLPRIENTFQKLYQRIT